MNKPKLYDTIKEDYDTGYIPYEILLNTIEWIEKRKIILKRDNKKCTSCNKPATQYIDHKHVFILERTRDFEYYDKEKKKIVQGKYVETGSSISDKHVYLTVHHKFYLEGNLPWEYTDEDLITLCNWCHWDLHQNSVVPVYAVHPDGTRFERDFQPCFRCNGAGYFPEYKHVQGGICFRCRGSKFEELIGKSVI